MSKGATLVLGASAKPDRYSNLAVRRLRAKLGDDTAAPRYVLTIRGVGFKLGSG